MQYQGHFSFNIDEADENRHGYFNCVVEAADVEKAIEKLQAFIRSLKQDPEDDMFEDVEKVFLDSLVEIKSIPEAGFLSYFVEWDADGAGSVQGSTRGASDEEVTEYEEVPEEYDEDGGYTSEPFLEF